MRTWGRILQRGISALVIVFLFAVRVSTCLCVSLQRAAEFCILRKNSSWFLLLFQKMERGDRRGFWLRFVDLQASQRAPASRRAAVMASANNGASAQGYASRAVGRQSDSAEATAYVASAPRPRASRDELCACHAQLLVYACICIMRDICMHIYIYV